MKAWAKKAKRFASVLLCGIVVTTIISTSANAVVACGSSDDGYRCHTNSIDGGYYHTFGDKVMNYGVGQYGNHRRYYWTSGLDGITETMTESAVMSWVNTSGSGTPGVYTSISIRETTNKSDAMFEIVKNNSIGPYTLGVTTFYLFSNEIKLQNGKLPQNYGWTRCELNLDTLSELTYSNRQGTIAHELGHAMGLSHQNCRASSIMCQYGLGRTALRADKEDLHTINHLYD